MGLHPIILKASHPGYLGSGEVRPSIVDVLIGLGWRGARRARAVATPSAKVSTQHLEPTRQHRRRPRLLRVSASPEWWELADSSRGRPPCRLDQRVPGAMVVHLALM
ncbi:MAG: hypothetical protein V9E81_06810 [Marmoricola sp.]